MVLIIPANAERRPKSKLLTVRQAKHIYIPRRDKELSSHIRQWNQARGEIGKEIYKVHYHWPLVKSSKSFGARDRLYIFGHGNFGRGVGPSNKPLSANELAKRLKSDGLADDREIRLLCCWSGELMPEYEEEYAVRLLRAIHQLPSYRKNRERSNAEKKIKYDTLARGWERRRWCLDYI